jgi:GNAT superfamily N-acetyltransferase
MLTLIRTTSEHQDFILLVKQLDAELATIDGKEHDFYAQYNKIDHLKQVVIAYEDNKAVGCGAFKEIEPSCVEIKRMYTAKECRSKGVATQVLSELEKWASELLFLETRLETGKRQTNAIALYTSKAYQRIENYGPYVGVDNSLCFRKVL